MKKIVYIFSFCLSFGFFQDLKAKEFSSPFNQCSLFQHGTIINECPVLDFNVDDACASEKVRSPKKKRKPRGIKTIRFYFFNDYFFLAEVAQKQIVLPLQVFYMLRFFSSNEERGPPFIV